MSDRKQETEIGVERPGGIGVEGVRRKVRLVDVIKPEEVGMKGNIVTVEVKDSRGRKTERSRVILTEE